MPDDLINWCLSQGTYGLKRFLRDGYKCVLEDKNRRFYDKRELQVTWNTCCVCYRFCDPLLLDSFLNRLNRCHLKMDLESFNLDSCHSPLYSCMTVFYCLLCTPISPSKVQGESLFVRALLVCTHLVSQDLEWLSFSFLPLQYEWSPPTAKI